MRFYTLLILSLITLAACGVAPAAEPDVVNTDTNVVAAAEAPTETPVTVSIDNATPSPTTTATLTSTTTSTPLPINTLPPTATPTRVIQTPTVTATLTLTPTLEQGAMVQQAVEAVVNVRGGPGTTYPVVGRFQPGAEALVVGRNADTTWWQIASTPDITATESISGWVYAELVTFSGSVTQVAVVEAPPPPPTATPAPVVAEADAPAEAAPVEEEAAPSPEELTEQLSCGKDFCVTYQAMVPIWENGGCVGNHSIYITVLQGPPPGTPMDGVVIGDTYNNVEVASGSHGPGRTEITLWSNSMTLVAKRHIDDTPYTSEESFNFTSHDELIPAEVLAANGYCEGRVEKCREAQQHNQVCRGHYSWRVTFHKFN